MARKYDLICFDLDGTLIEEENGDILWKRMSVMVHGSDKISNERYELYKKGMLGLKKWADMDLSEWKSAGMTKDIISSQAKHSRLNPGAKELLNKLKEEGYKLGIISGSVGILLDVVFPDHPFDDVFINKIYFDNEGNIDSWTVTEYGNKLKSEALKIIAKRENIPMSRTVFVGDHINDISAAKAAGLSISYNSKSKELDDVCDVVLRKVDMTQILDHLYS